MLHMLVSISKKLENCDMSVQRFIKSFFFLLMNISYVQSTMKNK